MRYTFMGLILWFMAGVMTVSAGSLEVEGLGKFPFRHNMEVTAAGGAAESFLRTGNDSRRDIEKMVRLLSVPPGMESCFGNGSFSDDTVRMYQIRTKDMEGEYTALLFVVSGKECPCRNGRDKKPELPKRQIVKEKLQCISGEDRKAGFSFRNAENQSHRIRGGAGPQVGEGKGTEYKGGAFRFFSLAAL